jgi:mRNA-degrading endonuclease toxin of MazEF toxin-antitoxin module
MVDKIVTIHKRKVGKRLGLLDRADVLRLDHRAIMVFLGLA